MLYQKDGEGFLVRCYLNRIFAPQELEHLQRSRSVKEPKDLPALRCPSCDALLGVPARYKDGRLCFRLVPDAIMKKVGIFRT